MLEGRSPALLSSHLLFFDPLGGFNSHPRICLAPVLFVAARMRCYNVRVSVRRCGTFIPSGIQAIPSELAT